MILPWHERGDMMKRFIEGADREQATLLPECLEDWIDENNPVRVIDVFVEELDLGVLGFIGVTPKTTGRPSYHPSVLLKLYVYSYLNHVQSSRRLEREAGRNMEVMWLTGRHAAVSLWIEQDAKPKQVTTWASHASIQFTLDTYGHLWKDARSDQAIAQGIEKSIIA